MMHFEVVFVKGLRSVSSWVQLGFFGFFVGGFFACGCPVVLAPFVQKTILSPMSLLLCQRSVDYIYVGTFLGSLFR